MNFKEKYHHNKVDYWKNDNRNQLAKREFQTISYLLKIFYKYELKDGFKVLDLGSGDQFLKNEFEKRNMHYYSLDISDLDFEKDRFGFEENTFDLIISLAVLEHIKNPDIFLNECHKTLKKNAYIFLSTPNWKYSKNIFFDDVTHVKPYSPESLNELLTIKEFKDIKIMPNLRCKSKWWYEGKFSFFKACYLLPFKSDVKFIPNFLKGKSRGLFGIGKKNDDKN